VVREAPGANRLHLLNLPENLWLEAPEEKRHLVLLHLAKLHRVRPDLLLHQPDLKLLLQALVDLQLRELPAELALREPQPPRLMCRLRFPQPIG
jgi:hypothetical protein